METIFKNFPQIIADNEDLYYRNIRGIVESVDPEASILITRKISGITVRILPSNSSHLNGIIKEVNALNNTFGIKVEFSKSIKTTVSINFSIDF